ncbi:MAG TPA: hypothetical protein VHZ56_12490, partial [Devosia sp.]|nr:hypothetical protein [Devosia sp.]
MQLDSFTILVAGCAVLIMLGLILGFMWVRDRATTALLWWSLPFLLGGAALVFYTAPTWDTDVVAISFGNALRMLALGCLWQGLRVFQGRRALLWPLLLVCVGWMTLCFVPAFVGSMVARIVVVSLLNTALCALSAHELWRNRAETLASRWPTIVVFSSFALLMFVRSALVPIAPFPVGARPLDSTWLAVFMWVVFGHAILGAVLFIAMIKERREAEQR